MRAPADRSPEIAITGMSCRLPGGIDTPHALWRALLDEKDLITEVPADRFDSNRFVQSDASRPERTYTVAGGFLPDIAGFDASFFGMSPRETSRVDPQQRLMLELAVEAVEDAGSDLSELAGSSSGVFVGVSASDYAALQWAAPQSISGHTNAGIALSNVANRISYALDLRGPSLAVDTACSSSLVAVHEAIAWLGRGEGRVALAGGVNVLLNPLLYVGFAKASMLSPTGRCRTFSADADGYVRSEGGGVLVLKRLNDALADGDRIHAVVCGSGVNSDGRTQGLAVPSRAAQQSLLTDVYARSGVNPDELVYFEAHGTGTVVGDPIECTAIGRALGEHRDRPLPIGSVKTNVGHLEPASGVPGLLKSILVLREGTIPASLHGTPVNPAIDFQGLGLELVSSHRPVDGLSRRPIAGVNSFGFGGTNAHVILAAPPAPTPRPAPTPGPLPVLVSARSRAALREAAAGLAQRLLSAAPEEFPDISYTTVRRRGHPFRAAVRATNAEDAARQLRHLAERDLVPWTKSADSRIVFVFSGNGSQWAGMGTDLLAGDSSFRRVVEELDGRLAPLLRWSVAEEMVAEPSRSRLSRTEVAQPMLFVVQVALTAMLAEHGVRPSAVIGHSVGEAAAAYVSGALQLDDAIHLVVTRSRAQGRTNGTGAMAAVGLSPQATEQVLATYLGRLELAALNSDRAVTVSGDPAALAELGANLTRQGVFFHKLDLDYGFHSWTMDPIEAEVREELAELASRAPDLPMISTVTGRPVQGGDLDADYWWQNVRRPVRFSPAIAHLVRQDHDTFLEIGPHPVLRGYLTRHTLDDGSPVAVVPTLLRDTDGASAVETVITTLLARGAGVDWGQYFPRGGRVTTMPTYPWQRERHWNGDRGLFGILDHPLLGERIQVLEPTWRTSLDSAGGRWLPDHRVAGTVVLPAAAYLEMAFAAGARVLDSPVEVVSLHLPEALTVSEDTAEGPDGADTVLQVSLSDEDGLLRVASQQTGQTDWRLHARGRVRRLLAPAPPRLDLVALHALLPGVLDRNGHYSAAADVGLEYGPEFRVLDSLHVGDGEVVARYVLAEAGPCPTAHPAILDGALQAVLPLVAQHAPGTQVVPERFGLVRAWRASTASGWIHVRMGALTEREAVFTISVSDDAGDVTVRMEECRLRLLPHARDNSPGRYAVTLRAAPHQNVSAGTSPLPPSADIMRTAAPLVASSSARWSPDEYTQFVARAHKLTAHVIHATVTSLLPGAARPGVTFDIQALIEAGMLTKHEHVVESLAGIACDNGTMELAAGDGTHPAWRLVGEVAPEQVFRDLVRDFPEYSPDLVVRGRCARHLSDILRGRINPLDIVFGESGQRFYDTTPHLRHSNNCAAAVAAAIADAWPEDRPLRVLEVGAGTGATTAALLPVLPAGCTRYTFTDVSEAFLIRAAARFRGHDVVDYQLFDLERDPEDQGLAASSFDLIVAANVLHATANVTDTLRRLASLLVDSGRMLVYEIHDAELFAPIFGLLDGWWAAEDQRRGTGSPLLSVPVWQSLLTEAGFGEVVTAGEPDGEPAGSVLLATRKPGGPTGTVPLPKLTVDELSWYVTVESPASAVQADALAAELNSVGHRARVTPVTADRGQNGTAVVLLLDNEPNMETRASSCVERRIGIVQTLLAAGPLAELHLVTAPTGLHPRPDRPVDPAAAALWGAVRVLANEQPALVVRKISFERTGDVVADTRRLVTELLAPTDDDEVVLTSTGRFVPRLIAAEPTVDHIGLDDVPSVLELRDPGASYRLGWVQTATADVGSCEVIIAVRAAGLNYHDTLKARGKLPGDATEGGLSGAWLGMECAGVVTEVGEEVSTIRPGDRVFAVASRSLGTHVVADSRFVGHIPEGLSFTQAAGMPVVFLTTQYALEYSARLSRGETLLVHGAAGGIGLAAIQYARMVGAEVVATAGTPEKRDLLRLLGVTNVADSRAMDFAEQLHDVTHGGVDVVLNSLADEAIPRGLELLRPGGRFVELGKIDLYGDRRLPLRTLRKNITFITVDIDGLLRSDSNLMASQVATVASRMAAQAYRPVLGVTYPATRVGEAMTHLMHSRHIGKVVISLEDGVPAELSRTPPTLSPQATYLVTGGLSGFGAEIARWLVRRGARSIALVSRRGMTTPGAPELVRALTELRAQVSVFAADVADQHAMQEVVDIVDATGYPLAGVVHGAMVLDDAPFTDMTPEAIRAALRPKVDGALVLDQLTRDRPHDLFLLLSSAMATFGNPGQANYVAANMFMEAMVRERRRDGLPGLAVPLGTIGHTGFVARDEKLSRRLAKMLPPMPPEEVCLAFDDLLASGDEVTAVMRLEPGRLREFMRIDFPRLTAVSPSSASAADGGEDLRALLVTMDESSSEAAAVDVVTHLVAHVLSTVPDRLETTRKFSELGVDSLMATEVTAQLRTRLGCEISSLEVASHTVATLARRVLGKTNHAAPG